MAVEAAGGPPQIPDRPRPDRLAQPPNGKALERDMRALYHTGGYRDVMRPVYIGSVGGDGSENVMLSIKDLPDVVKDGSKREHVTEPPVKPVPDKVPERTEDEKPLWERAKTNGTGIVELFGKSNPKDMWKVNKSTLRAMVDGKIPTPPELETVVSEFSTSARDGQKAFIEYYKEKVAS